MLVSTNDIKPGMTLDQEGELWTVLEWEHHKPGKGQPVVRMRLRNLKSGAVLDRTFRADEKVEVAVLEKREAQYSYRDGSTLYFMDLSSYEQVPVGVQEAGEALRWLKEGENCFLQLYQGRVVSVEVPVAVELRVAETEPGLKGDRQTGGTKPARLETGVVVQVPLFVSAGDLIRVDTRTGTYITRVQEGG